MIKVDFHCHTKYSPDSDTEPADIAKRCKEKGIDKIAITDHDSIEGALALKKIAPNLVIVGQEINAKGGEIIGLFLKKEIPAHLTPKETVNRIRGQGGLVYVPHPFDHFRAGLGQKGLDEIEKDIDIVEVFNGKTLIPAFNKKAYEYAKKKKKVMAAGSDSHQLETIGMTFNRIENFKNPKELLENLRKGKREQEYLGFGVYMRSAVSLIKSLLRKLNK
jgi:predicted metal-dependent phosphoesterase TrpH